MSEDYGHRHADATSRSAIRCVGAALLLIGFLLMEYESLRDAGYVLITAAPILIWLSFLHPRSLHPLPGEKPKP